MRYAAIATERPIERPLTFHIPPELEGHLLPGHLVRLDIRTAAEPGIVLSVHDDPPLTPDGQPIRTKPVIETIHPEPLLTESQMQLARWISDRYHAALGPCLWLMLPPGISGKRDQLITLEKPDASGIDSDERKIISALGKRGTLSGTQLNRILRHGRWKKPVRDLKARGIVSSQSILTKPRVKPLNVQVVQLAIHRDRIQDTRRYLGKSNRVSALLEAVITLADDLGYAPPVDEVLALPGVGPATLDKLLESGVVDLYDGDAIQPPDDIESALFHLRGGETDLHVLDVLAREDDAVDVSWVYAQTGATLDTLKRLAERQFIHLGETRHWRDSLAERDFVPLAAPRLTPGQRDVWRVVKAALEPAPSLTPGDAASDSRHRVFLLHGVTGSGKTEIYLRAIEHVIKQGRQAILLVPEIALTAQMMRRVGARFPQRLAIVHSRLSVGERYDTWQRARDGEIDVVVGARSALFTPLPNVGVIILDEEHDASYKQSPPVSGPFYHTRDVAEFMAASNGAVVMMGSATPDIETRFRAERDHIGYLHLPDRIMGHRIKVREQAVQMGIDTRYDTLVDGSDALTIPLPPVDVVDMRDELKAGNVDMFSRALQDALGETLVRGEQAILFLNRRGTSTYVFCRDCGYVVTCKRCEMPLIYHTQDGRLHCHHCGLTQANVTVCPQCHSTRIKYFGAGTQQVEAAFSAHFPDAIALRWDSDTAAAAGAHDLILDRFSAHQADVLIGTQMIAKGLDLPLVTLVGVISADVGLNLPDFRAGERAFQVLTQVAGRAGRGLLGGRVILQTYQPEHYAIQAAAKHNYTGFYTQEMGYRREMGYPPYRRMVRLLFRNEHEGRAHTDAEWAAEAIRHNIAKQAMTGTEIIGPAPCFFNKMNNLYRWQILLRGPNPTQALDGVDPGKLGYIDVDPADVL